MIYGEHLSAHEATVKCSCGVTATAEAHDANGYSLGWFCRRCGDRERKAQQRRMKSARAIVRKTP
jgi:hypothetical protein